MAIAGQKGYIRGMVQSTNFAEKKPPVADDSLTAEQDAALTLAINRGEAQFQAGEGIQGDVVFAWMRSWGTEHEQPPPTRKTRRA
jgi:predicted transcriptional regulator